LGNRVQVGERGRGERYDSGDERDPSYPAQTFSGAPRRMAFRRRRGAACGATKLHSKTVSALGANQGLIDGRLESSLLRKT
jgi:hypothetical protein